MPSWVISLGIASLMAAAVVVLWRFAGRIDDQHPRCRACRYNVQGLSSTTCPECGSELTTVGLWSPRRARLGIAAIQVILLAVVVLLLLSVALERFERTFPLLVQASRSDQLAPITTATTTHFAVRASTQAWLPVTQHQAPWWNQYRRIPASLFPAPHRSVEFVVSFHPVSGIRSIDQADSYWIDHADGRSEQFKGIVDEAVLSTWLASLPIAYSADPRAAVSHQLLDLLELHLYADRFSVVNDPSIGRTDAVTADGLYPLQPLLGQGTLTARTRWLEPALWCVLGLMAWGLLSYWLWRAAWRSPAPSLPPTP